MSANDLGHLPTSMVEVLSTWADRSPDNLAFCFLIDGEQEGPSLSYAGLDREAKAIAVALREAAESGDRALLQYAPGLEFISAFFGCLYAGVIPVSVYPPRLDRLAQSLQTLANIVADCKPRVLLTSAAIAPFLSGGIPGGASSHPLRCIVTDQVDSGKASHWRPVQIDDDMIALLQYTSGSTASPKGVAVTHRNLMHNEYLIQTALEHSGPGSGVSWLPPYHDLGLVGGLLQSVFHGASCRFMSPLVFLRNPYLWLQAISRYRADTSGGPNFAFDFCVQRISSEQKATLDLSHWSIAAIGSEPINPGTIERFTAAFASCGFRPETFYPCYGLAEATLFVAGGAKMAPPVIRALNARELEQGVVVAASPGEGNARVLVGCGHAWFDQEIVIVHPETRTTCAAGCVGEIWAAGPSIARGYWNRPDETEKTFKAYTSDTGKGPYLRTGDLGFIQDGELFVTGRLKDLIVIRGRNHQPQDIEETVQSIHPAFRPGCGAAFEITIDGRPAVVVVQEIDRAYRKTDLSQLIGDIRQAVAERHDLQLHDIQLIEQGTIPKTSSGKVQRHRCQIGYEQGTLRRLKPREA